MDSDPDSQSLAVQILIIVILTALNAFFAAAEMAFVSLDQRKIKETALQGDKKSLNILKLLGNPDNFLATIQVAITLAGFFSSASAATSFAVRLKPILTNVPGGEQIAVVIVTIALSYITLVFGELYPKQVALQKAEEIAKLTVGPILLVQTFAMPFVKLLSFSTSILKRMTPIDFNNEEEKMTRDEFRAYLENSQKEGAIDLNEFSMLRGVMSMDTKMAKEIMVPRTDTFMIDYKDGNKKNIPLLLDCRYSRVPVYETDKDNIIGVLHVKSLLQASRTTNLDEINIREIMNTPLSVPETIYMNDLLYEMKHTRNQIAILNDEYGGTVGIVTLEDLLEEIVGDIDDEYDETHQLVEQLTENRYLVAGSTPLSKFNEFFDTNIKSNNVDSIAGYFITEYGNIPQKGEKISIKHKNYVFTANEIEGSRVMSLFIERNADSVDNKAAVQKIVSNDQLQLQ
ncbi:MULTISPECIES: hemolysin family protein [Carnobacterium]|uniref:Hemolysin family protein n=2 Tax=Carnobacterium TaxID=2747 RepID=A0ABW4NKI2_9LACT|nr:MULTISPECIES: hemolysin family protein [unclassified Carnobacterium]ALV21761.1 Magnesium and cobalt efflux protein CorC [Carnobacterium sp. CP1]QQP69763.1 HlyC/CorC family transporter [Carnobacterium sp. CS13]